MAQLLSFCIFFFGLCSLPSVATANLPIEGQYTGKGSWYNDGQLADVYETSLTITQDNLLSVYIDKFGARTRELSYRGTQENLILTILHNSVGTGFCYNTTCVFSWNENEAQLQEIWNFNGSTLERNGRRMSRGRWVIWKDSLKLDTGSAQF